MDNVVDIFSSRAAKKRSEAHDFIAQMFNVIAAVIVFLFSLR